MYLSRDSMSSRGVSFSFSWAMLIFVSGPYSSLHIRLQFACKTQGDIFWTVSITTAPKSLRFVIDNQMTPNVLINSSALVTPGTQKFNFQKCSTHCTLTYLVFLMTNISHRTWLKFKHNWILTLKLLITPSTKYILLIINFWFFKTIFLTD